MNRMLRWLFTLGIAYPIVWIWLGVSVFNKKRLPINGPAIIVANHNSHLDVLLLFTLFPFSTLMKVQPVAAADYFLKNKFIAWFALKVIGIIPVYRGVNKANPLQTCVDALAENKIIILFPEGTRGEPGKFSKFKSGIWHLSQKCQNVPITPVYIHGLDRSMGKGQKMPLPFFIDIYIDEPILFNDDRVSFKKELLNRFIELQHHATRKYYEIG